jgi:hypothetical protein
MTGLVQADAMATISRRNAVTALVWVAVVAGWIAVLILIACSPALVAMVYRWAL